MITDFDKAISMLTDGGVEFIDLDLLGEVAGGGTYDELLPHSHEVDAFGRRFRIVKLGKLIELKRAAGRSKDLEVLAELQLILERHRRGGRSD